MITAPYTETKTIEIKDKMPQDEEKKANKKKLKKAQTTSIESIEKLEKKPKVKA